MADRPWSDTDRELVAGLVRALPPPLPPGSIGGLGPSPEEFADRVLAAVAPLIAARVRAEERRQVVDEIARDFGRHCHCTTPDPPCNAELLVAAVRGYATTEEPDDAE